MWPALHRVPAQEKGTTACAPWRARQTKKMWWTAHKPCGACLPTAAVRNAHPNARCISCAPVSAFRPGNQPAFSRSSSSRSLAPCYSQAMPAGSSPGLLVKRRMRLAAKSKLIVGAFRHCCNSAAPLHQSAGCRVSWEAWHGAPLAAMHLIEKQSAPWKRRRRPGNWTSPCSCCRA